MRFNPAYTSLREPLDPECENVQVLISRKIDGELDAAGAQALKAHLDQCPACRRTLEQQTEQTADLVKSLSALWPEDHPVKKKLSNPRLAWMLTRVGGSCGVAFAAALAWALWADSTANSSHNGVVLDPSDGSRPVSRGAPPTSVNLTPPTRKLFEDLIPPQPNVAADDFDDDEPFEFETPCELRTSPAPRPPAGKMAIPAYLSADLPRAVFCARDLAPASLEQTQSFASLNETRSVEPLHGVSMAYSLIRQNGERESGKVLLLGDIAHDRGLLRLQTDRGELIDAPQTTWENSFTIERRTVIRSFLSMCSDPHYRAELEQLCKP